MADSHRHKHDGPGDGPARERDGERLVKDTTLYTLGIAATRFANLLLLPLYLSLLSKEEYGALGVLEQLVQVLVMLAMAGGMEALVKIGIELRETPAAQLRLVTTMTTWMLLTGLAMAALSALLWPWLDDLLGGVRLWPMGLYALSGVAGSAAFQSLSAHLQVTGEAKKHTLFAALRTALHVAIAVPLLLFTDLGVNALLLAGSLSYWLGTLLLVRRLPVGTAFAFDWSLLKRVLRYGVPLLPHLIASVLLQATDKFMLAASDHGLAAVGVYSVGGRIASGVMMLGLGMQRAWLPYFFREAGRDDDAGWQRVRRLSYWSMAGMATAVAGLSLLAPELVVVIAPAGYAAAAAITAVLCLSALLRTGAQVAGSVVLHSATASHTIWFASVPAALVNLLLNHLFIPEYGALGAAWSTTAAMALNMLLTLALARRIRPVPFRYGALAILVGAVLAMVLWAGAAPLLLRLALCAVVPLLAVAFDARFVRAELQRRLAARAQRRAP